MDLPTHMYMYMLLNVFFYVSAKEFEDFNINIVTFDVFIDTSQILYEFFFKYF